MVTQHPRNSIHLFTIICACRYNILARDARDGMPLVHTRMKLHLISGSGQVITRFTCTQPRSNNAGECGRSAIVHDGLQQYVCDVHNIITTAKASPTIYAAAVDEGMSYLTICAKYTLANNITSSFLCSQHHLWPSLLHTRVLPWNGREGYPRRAGHQFWRQMAPYWRETYTQLPCSWGTILYHHLSSDLTRRVHIAHHLHSFHSDGSELPLVWGCGQSHTPPIQWKDTRCTTADFTSDSDSTTAVYKHSPKNTAFNTTLLLWRKGKYTQICIEMQTFALHLIPQTRLCTWIANVYLGRGFNMAKDRTPIWYPQNSFHILPHQQQKGLGW